MHNKLPFSEICIHSIRGTTIASPTYSTDPAATMPSPSQRPQSVQHNRRARRALTNLSPHTLRCRVHWQAKFGTASLASCPLRLQLAVGEDCSFMTQPTRPRGILAASAVGPLVAARLDACRYQRCDFTVGHGTPVVAWPAMPRTWTSCPGATEANVLLFVQNGLLH